MAWNQLVGADTSVQDYAGFCLRFTQSVFGAPAVHPSAWEAWLAVDGKHEDRNLPDVAVPVWFESWGTYGEPAVYDNWGHAAVWIPGTGIFSSPGSGYGNHWFSSIEEAESQWGMRFVGWSESINGLQVASWAGDSAAPSPAPTGPTINGDVYTIQPGDSYWAIAEFVWGGDNATIAANMSRIADLNGGKALFAGDTVLLNAPAPVEVPAEPAPVEPAPVVDPTPVVAPEATPTPQPVKKIKEKKPVSAEQIAKQEAELAALPTIDLGVIIPTVKGRKIAYIAFAVIAFLVGNIGVGFAAAGMGWPVWLVVTVAVTNNMAPLFATLAVANASNKK